MSRSVLRRPEAGAPGDPPRRRDVDHPPDPVLLGVQRLAGNRAAAQLARRLGPSGTSTVRTAAEQLAVVQRFGSEEHRSLGDRATGGATYDLGSTAPGVAGFPGSVVLSHGDIVMLSGDYFDPRDTLRRDGAEVPNPDSLFRLLAMPSASPGQMPGTRDEVLCAIYEIAPKDPRFDVGGTWAELREHAATLASPAQAALIRTGVKPPFSDAVMERVKERYLRLASLNIEHFVAPRAGGAAPGDVSALSTYRTLHEDALRRAFEAGQNGQNPVMARAREAAAQHFLTDSFAAGHVRTPRQSIRDHWQAVYPLFWSNLQKKIALDVARYINEHQWNAGTMFGTVSVIFDGVYQQVREKTATMPAFGFDDLVSMVAHDVDNETGLAVLNDFEERWTTFGDSHLDQPDVANRTREMAERAVADGVADVEHAHHMGTVAPGFLDDASIFAGVRVRPGASAVAPGKFEPEKHCPRLDPDVPTQQNWQATSMDALWGMAVRSDLPGRTYGTAFQDAVAAGEIHEKFETMASMFPEAVPVWGSVAGIPGIRDAVGMLDPRTAFREGFVKPLVRDTRSGLRAIIDFDPSQGQAWFNVDDAAREDVEGMGEQQLAGLTLNSRADRIKSLVEGWTNYVDEADGELVITLFRTASPADRPHLYRLVEGHAWGGDWVHGVLESDDEIWNALSRPQLRRLRDLINGG